MSINLLISVVIIIILFLAPYFYNRLALKKDTEIVIPKEGRYALLTKGNLFYKWYEPDIESEEIVILVHGFSTPSFVWDDVKEFLVNSGYKVLVYDHYGRGYSSRPRVNYDQDLYTSSLKELIDFLGIKSKVHLVGYSMGGPIIGYFSKKYPQLVKSNHYIAPAGLMRVGQSSITSFLFKLMTLPIVGDYLSTSFPSMLYGGNARPQLSTKDDPIKVDQKKIHRLLEEQMKYEGFTRSLLSTAKNFNLVDTRSMYSNLSQLNIPSSVIWGTNDEICSYVGMQEMKELFPNIEITEVDKGMHDITLAQPTVVGLHLKRCLDKFCK